MPRSISPELGSSEESLFCARCLTNQHLLTQTLASYLPAPTHPEYAQFEKSYPKYRKELEERYPQVCRNCEPRVRERLQVTGYAAKTDHLRRMVERTRNGQAKRLRPWGWQDNVVALAAVCWWISLVVQLAWHALSAIKWTDEPIGLRQQDALRDFPLTLSECMRRSLGSGPLDSACDKSYRTLVGKTIMLGLLSAWWNPRLRQKLRGNVGRMVGLVEYYKLQVVFLLLRAAAWGLLAQSSAFGSDTKQAKATHSFMVAFIAIVSHICLFNQHC